MHSLTPGPSQNSDRSAECVSPSGTRSQASTQRGAAAVIFALLIPVLFAAVAIAVDLGRLVYERGQLSNALDAAALAGAYNLPSDPLGAQTAAVTFAKANDPGADPAVTFWCIVASSGATKTPVSSQMPSVCNPGTTAGAKCNEQICAIPCSPVSGHTCNTITVRDDKVVPFSFAPAIGISSGNTGSLASDACRGSCGAQNFNTMDVALVADRTGSMSPADRDQMVAGIKSTLQTMTREQQYVALGTIHRSILSPPTGTCTTAPSGSATSGPWMPVPFSSDYTLNPATPGATPALNTNSALFKGLDCLKSTKTSASSQGTYLAAPMKAAARYVLGSPYTPNNLGSLPARPTTPKKAIIFETDGEPNEVTIAGSSNLLTNSNDIGSADPATACNNLKTVAANTKAANVLIITVAFGDAISDNTKCGTQLVRNVLASAASPDASGNDSDSDNDCGTLARRATENSDGDFFFCAATGAELGPIFVTAVNAINPNSRLVRIPG